MLIYILGGAVAGAVIGHLIPPGSLFWFAVGAISGCLLQRIWGRHY